MFTTSALLQSPYSGSSDQPSCLDAPGLLALPVTAPTTVTLSQQATERY